jgi:gliding motility-associated-like protein
LQCNQLSTNLTATPFNVGETTSYGVSSIPHAPPIAYNAAGGTAVSVNTDDVWSGVINLPFPFCFFGQTYNSCLIGSNGAISFNTASAGAYHPWPFSASVPSTALTSAGNIFGPYHDIDPSVAGTVRWYLLGQAPCRTFIVSYNNLGHYDCTNLRSTHMMVLYETTNIIQVFVNNKQTCNGWNSGNTVIGIQNPAGTVGYTPPGRNTGNWTVTSPEAWQFTPSGAPIYSAVQWFNGPTLVGTGNTVSVSPVGTTTYTARTTYTRCDGLQIPVEDDVTVTYDGVVVSVTPSNTFACAGATTTLTASSPTATNYVWSPGGMTGPVVNVSPGSTTTYTVTASNTVNGCSATASGTVTVAQPISSACNVLYVTPTGTPSGTGSKASPMDLITALEAGACNGTIVKMAVGDYVTDTAITKVTSYITLEGGFDPTLNWDKVSTAGATRILRTATQTTSLVSGTGITNETGANPEVVAIVVNNQDGFKFQDVTIQTVNLGGGTTYSGYQGVDMVALRLNSCSNYSLTRTQVLAGSASNGANQIFLIPATNGGNSTAMQITANGAGANITNSFIQAGAAGNGGTGGGANGTSSNISITGTALVSNDNAFNLAAQPTIRMDDVACTATNIEFSAAASNSWLFSTISTPSSATGANVNTQYSNLGRKNITYGANLYAGFANIILDDQVNPTFTTSATFHQGQYRVCAGESVSFTATNAGVGYIYNWNLDGGAAGTNVFNGVNLNTVSGTFNTPGVYDIALTYETNCCGVSTPTILTLYVEEQPQAIMPANTDFCLGTFGGVSLTVGGGTTGGSISWSPVAGLSATDTYTVVALPTSTTTYNVILQDSTGLCDANGSVTVSVIYLVLTPSATASNCSVLGSASVSVTGGSGNYSYLWDNGGNTASIANLQPGTYQVIVTDVTEGCLDSISVTVPAGPGALTGVITSTDITCFGSSNGTATVTMSGGTAPFVYDWSHLAPTAPTASTVQTVTNLLAGTYTVEVTDNTGCDFTATILVDEPNDLYFSVDSVSLPTCFENNDGVIEVTVDGGTRPYTYTWSTGTPVVIVNDGVVAYNLAQDVYTLVVVDSAGCSDSITFDLSVAQLFGNVSDTICYGASYTFPDGSVVILTSNITRLDTIQNAASCDSIVTSQVTVLPQKTGLVDTTLCIGQSITINGTVYSTNTVGATQVFSNVGPLNCDSTVTINVTILDFVTQNIDTTLCLGETLTVNGVTYSTTGIFNDTLLHANSTCDSIRYVIDLQIFSPTTQVVNETLCQGESVTVNGQSYNAPGQYLDTLSHPILGCDSILYTINIQVDSVSLVTINERICQGSSFTFNGTTYTATGQYFDTLSYQVSLCDSVQYTINLQIDSFTIENIDTTICQGQSFTFNGITYNQTGVYFDTLFYNVSGCDLIQYVIDLTVDSFTTITIDTTICYNETLTVNGQTYTSTGLYFSDVPYTQSGCDSIRYVVDLVVQGLNVVDVDTVVCFGESITVNGQVYAATGLYQDTLVYANTGCDRTHYNIDLTVLNEKLGQIDTVICEGESVTINGTTYTTTTLGAVEVFTVGAEACDSTVTINVTVNPLPSLALTANPDTILFGDNSNLEALGTGSFAWNSGENTSSIVVNPTETTSYTVELTDANGCASEASITVFVLTIAGDEAIVPDAFSPNGDNLNEVFKVVNADAFQDIELIIYNRWGEILHRESGIQTHGWDGTFNGTPQPVESYIYVIQLTSQNNETFVLSGNVSLIR